MIVTIDGPTASGKSSVAKAVAKKLNFYYLNTGMLYRAVTYLLVTYFGYTKETLQNVAVSDLNACTNPAVLEYRYDSQDGVQIMYKSQLITQFLKDASIDILVCVISPQPLVRDHLSEVQRLIAHKNNSIIEGRDTGSVVFPEADYKFYLTAALPVRAARWQNDQAKLGNKYSLAECQECVQFRDTKDVTRSHSPLVIPQDAIIVDNSDLNFEQTVQFFLHVILEKKQV